MTKLFLQTFSRLFAKISFLKRKRSLVFLVSATLLVSLAALTTFFYLRDIKSEYDILTQQRTNRLVQLLSQIQSLDTAPAAPGGKSSRGPAAVEVNETERKRISEVLLQKAHDVRDIDFYVIQKDGEIINSVNTGPLSEGQKETLNRFNEVQIFENVAVATTPSGNVTISAGYNRNWPEFRKQALISLAKSAVVELALIVALVAGLVVFFARDIRRLVKRLELGTAKYDDGKAVSRESDRIMRTLRNFEDRVIQMESSQQHFKNMLFSAITHEINSKKIPPYDFSCTMARVDLNGFSELNRIMEPSLFRKMIDQLFVECMAVVNRYGGFMSEYLGDEIIFYFKDEQWKRSALVAFGCIKQLNKVASAITEQYASDLPFELKFKSALSHGNLTVRRGARELEISGFPFIESVRILSEVKERGTFIILASPEINRRLQGFVPSTPYTVAELKGIGSMEIFKLQLETDLNAALKSGVYEGLDQFRDADSLITILQWIDEQFSLETDFLTLKMRPLLPILSQIFVRTFTDEKVENTMRLVLEVFIKKDPDNIALSAFVSFVGRLIAPDAVSHKLKLLFIDLSRNSNPRIRANTIEAMGRLNLLREIKAPGIKDHNRVVANYMVATGTRDFDKTLTSKLISLLTSRDENLRASTLFAIGEIAHYHLERNPVHLRSSEIFQSFMTEVLRCLYDESEMVRRQTLRMAAKVDDPLVSAEVERYRIELQQLSAKDRLTELTAHYDSTSQAS